MSKKKKLAWPGVSRRSVTPRDLSNTGSPAGFPKTRAKKRGGKWRIKSAMLSLCLCECGPHSPIATEITITHQENQHTRFACVLHVLCMWQLFAFLAKISCIHGAFHSVWEIEFLFILRMAVKTKLPKTFRIDCFKGEHPVFQGCFIVAEPVC